jgi:hypothetical protein
VNVDKHAGIVGNESKFVTEAAKVGFVPRLSVCMAVGSLDDADVSLERVMRSGEQPVRTGAALDVRAEVAVVTVDVAMKSVANVPAPRGSATKWLNAVGMSVTVAVVSLEVAVMSLALATKSVRPRGTRRLHRTARSTILHGVAAWCSYP